MHIDPNFRPHIRRRAPAVALVLLIVGLGVFGTGIRAVEPGEPLTIGRYVKYWSKALGEERTLLITTPAGYERLDRRHPVVYVLDGEGNHILAAAVTNFLARNNQMPPAIVVSITNTSRTRDFTPTAAADRPGSGGGAKFMEFFKTELVPWVEQNYRTEPYRILVGHSLCGMYAIWTMLAEPDLFQGLVAVSPYVMWDNDYVVRLAAERLAAIPDTRRSLFITLGNEPDYKPALGRFLKLMKEKAPKDTACRFVPLENETHGSVLLESIHRGLAAIYSGWQPSGDLLTLGLKGLEEHYRQLSRKYGYTIEVPEAMLNQLGYLYLQQRKDSDAAITVFRRNVELFPNSANVYDSLGEALEQTGQLEEAARAYREAVSRAEKNPDANLNIYRQNLARAEAACKEKSKTP